MELLFILYEPLVHLLNYKAVNNHPKIKNMSQFFENKIFLEWLKDSTQSKHNGVKIFDVRPDVKHYRVSQGITGPWKMQFFSIISFLNDLKFYDEERNKIS